MAGKFTLEAVFRAVDKMTGPVQRMGAGLDKFRKKASSALSDLDARVSKVSGALKEMAAVGAVVGAAAGAVALNVGKTGADFEQAITNVGAVSLMTRDQIADLEKKALELGATTKFSATEVANAMEMMGKAGFTNAEILSGVGGILAAAAAEGAGLEETASNISNVMKGMGLASSEAGRVADVLTLASSRTNSSISSLGESMKNVSSTARQLGIPLEATVGMVALLQDVGLDASEAGSATATMLTKLAAPSKAAAAEMKAMGVSFQDSTGNMLAPAKVLEQLVKSAEKSGGNMKQVAFFAELVGMRGQKAALNLQDLFKKGKVQDLNKELYNAAGSAEKMAGIRMDTLLGDVETLGGSVDSLKIALFNTQSGPLRGIVQGMTKWLDANQEFIVSGFVDFVKRAIPILEWFGAGLKKGFADALPAVRGVVSVLGRLFGDEGKTAEMQAFAWGKRIAQWGTAFALLVLSIKAAQVAMFAFGAVTKGVQAGVFLFTGGIKAAQAALVWYRVAAEAGVAKTIALSVASKVAAADAVLMKMGILGVNGALTTTAAVAGAAALAVGAIVAVLMQISAWMDENGGLEGLGGFLGVGTSDWGFEGVDEVMNRQARRRADAEGRKLANAYQAPKRTEMPAYGPPTAQQKFDSIYGYGAASPVAGYGFEPQPSQPSAPAATPAAQPQVSTPWDNFAPQDMRELFKGTIDVNIRDPGNAVESVDVKNPGKALSPKNPRSGSN